MLPFCFCMLDCDNNDYRGDGVDLQRHGCARSSLTESYQRRYVIRSITGIVLVLT